MRVSQEEKAERLSRYKKNLEKQVKDLDERIKELQKTPVAAIPQSA